MIFSDYLFEEWRPALGCTEPASIAWAASLAASLGEGAPVSSARLTCDPRIYKNCYAVGIPHSSHKVGILWTVAIGSQLNDPKLGLQCFQAIDRDVLEGAERLLRDGSVTVEVDAGHDNLFIECEITRGEDVHVCTIEGDHTRVTRLLTNGKPHRLTVDPSRDRRALREELADRTLDELIELARSISDADRLRLREGMELNEAISRHGLSLLPERFVDSRDQDLLTRVGRLVCAGVYARMSGEDFVVMSLSGSGNKGIVCSAPLAVWGRAVDRPEQDIDEALALACLVTSLTTFHLGTLSAVCGCSNAAGIGLAAGLVMLEGGDAGAISMAINNMVGNVTGMICDGAKIGCGMKTMTSVDAAFRSTALALSGVGIPFTDGIVGRDGAESLRNLGHIATNGMAHTDAEILRIMQLKMSRGAAPSS